MGLATPLVFLGISVVLNIGLDILFVVPLGRHGGSRAAMATVIAQFVAGLGLFLYTWFAFPALPKNATGIGTGPP